MAHQHAPATPQLEREPSVEARSEGATADLAADLPPITPIGSSAAGMPGDSNGQPLRQAGVAQLQRRVGNQAVQRRLSGPATRPPSIQRAGGSAGVGLEVGTGGVKVELSTKFEKEIPMKYATAKLIPKAAAVAELKPTADMPASGTITREGAKSSVTVWKDEATAAGSAKFGELVYKQVTDSGWAVDKVDWETEVGIGETETGGEKGGLATGVKFSFKNGNEATVKAQLFESDTDKGMSGPKLSVEPVLKFLDTTLWERSDKGAKLSLNGEFKFEMALEPNWLEIFKELAKTGGRQVARNFARAALRGVTSGLLGAGGIIAGGVVTMFSFAMATMDNAEIKECRKQARAAVDGYVHGWCISWGIENFGNDGPEAFFNAGLSDGRAKLQGAVKQIQSHPVFAAWNFTEDELRPALKAQLRNHADQVYNEVEASVKTQIFTDFVLAFYQKQKASIFTPTYQARKNAIWVARGLGLKNADTLIPEE